VFAVGRQNFPVHLRAPVAEQVPVQPAVYSPRLEKNIAMALVPVDLTAEGTRLQFSAPFGTLDATVVPMPFYDPKKSLAKD
jgi:aminomethyltransferase